MGVMKAVGEAVAEGQSYNWDKLGMTHSLRCIGIAPWGYVERNTALISNDGFVSDICTMFVHYFNLITSLLDYNYCAIRKCYTSGFLECII